MKINWVTVIAIAAAILFAFLYFRTCNVPIVSDTRVEDSIRHVAKVNDSTYKAKVDSGFKKLDSLSKHDSTTQAKYDGLKPALNAVNKKNAELQQELAALKNSTNIDSLKQALENVNNAYLEAVNLLNQMAQACDSSQLAKDQKYSQAKNMLDQAGDQIRELRSERDAALADDHSKDSVINKLARQKKANSIWAKLTSIGLAISVAINIFKK